MIWNDTPQGCPVLNLHRYIGFLSPCAFLFSSFGEIWTIITYVWNKQYIISFYKSSFFSLSYLKGEDEGFTFAFNHFILLIWRDLVFTITFDNTPTEGWLYRSIADATHLIGPWGPTAPIYCPMVLYIDLVSIFNTFYR